MIEYLRMNYKKTLAIILAGSTFGLLAGCAPGGGMWMGSNQPSPVIQSNVMLLDSPPSWPYKVVGYVQAQGTTLTKDVDIFRGIQAEAAKIGAPAVILDRDFMDFSGTPDADSMLGQVLKGKAIAPVKLSREQRAKWLAERAAISQHSKPRPKVQTIGQ
jgi:hypothetical protein